MIGSRLNIICLESLSSESLFLRVENCKRMLHGLVSWLLESSRSNQSLCSHLVLWLSLCSYLLLWLRSILSWARYIKLQTLSIEHLIIVESWRCLIEADVLAGENLVVACTTLVSPLCSRVLEVILAFITNFYSILVALHQ